MKIKFLQKLLLGACVTCALIPNASHSMIITNESSEYEMEGSKLSISLTKSDTPSDTQNSGLHPVSSYSLEDHIIVPGINPQGTLHWAPPQDLMKFYTSFPPTHPNTKRELRIEVELLGFWKIPPERGEMDKAAQAQHNLSQRNQVMWTARSVEELKNILETAVVEWKSVKEAGQLLLSVRDRAGGGGAGR